MYAGSYHSVTFFHVRRVPADKAGGREHSKKDPLLFHRITRHPGLGATNEFLWRSTLVVYNGKQRIAAVGVPHSEMTDIPLWRTQ
jgi:hypothetical protein